jgi:hypothetical protein
MELPCLSGFTGKGVAADIPVWNKKSFEELLHLQASFPATTLREGKLLHAD